MNAIQEITHVWTDNHWGHENLVKLARTTFDNAKQVELLQILEYNKTVTNDDSVVLFMGDLGDKTAIERVMPQLLRGYKILILGNHDKYSKEFYLDFFDEVYDTPIFYHNRIVFSHIPIPVGPGVMNIHGHTHLINLDSPQHYNLSPEIVGYGLISIKEIRKIAFKLPKGTDKFLKEWYADIQVDVAPFERFDLFTNDKGLINVRLTNVLVQVKNKLRKMMPDTSYNSVLKKIKSKISDSISDDEIKVIIDKVIKKKLSKKYQAIYFS